MHSIEIGVSMPLGSIEEWRARIGTSWCALGRSLKSDSSHSVGRPRHQEWRGTLLSPAVLVIMLWILFSLVWKGEYLFVETPNRSVPTHDHLSGSLDLEFLLIQLIFLFCLLHSIFVNIYQILHQLLANSINCLSCWLHLKPLHVAVADFVTRQWNESELYNSKLTSCWFVTERIIPKLVWLEVALSALMVSLTAAVLRSLLLRSGDVERNPGPGRFPGMHSCRLCSLSSFVQICKAVPFEGCVNFLQTLIMSVLMQVTC